MAELLAVGVALVAVADGLAAVVALALPPDAVPGGGVGLLHPARASAAPTVSPTAYRVVLLRLTRVPLSRS